MRIFRRKERLMGNRFILGVVGEDEELANQALEEAVNEIKRIEALFTTFNDSSITNQINQKSGKSAVKVPEEFLQLMVRAEKISNLTEGAFDLSYGSLDKDFWNFNREMTQLPHPKDAKKAVELINFKNIELNSAEKTVFLKKEGMRIGFGGIGKGYAADQAKKLLIAKGFENGIVNASGDLCCWGKDENGNDWKITLANPDAPEEIIAQIPLKNYAVATSGTYEKFVWIEGKKYSHTIDPKTGYPVKGVKSVTVLAPFAELADALTTPVAVMGIQDGLNMLNQLNGIAAVIIDDQNNLYTTKNLNSKIFEPEKI